MDNLIKKPYEISLWEDKLLWHRRKLTFIDVEEKNYEPGIFYSQNLTVAGESEAPYTLDYDDYTDGRAYYKLDPDDEDGEKGWSEDDINISKETHPDWYENDKMLPNVVFQYYKERKLCIIGSNTMDSPARAVQPKLVSNVNGSNTLTFTIYTKYWDDFYGEYQDNPYKKLLTNERKIKLFYDEKWYDFIIKEVKEDSDKKSFSYTCKDLFINELSKSGFNIQLDAELENNMGNVEYLAEKILEESDWQLKTSETLKQTKEEPLYWIKIGTEIGYENMETGEEGKLLPGNEIYAFYSCISNKDPYLQFLYVANGKYEYDSDRVITNSPNYGIKLVDYDEEGKPTFAGQMAFHAAERGDKLIRQPITKFDAKIDKYVNVYSEINEGKEINELYGYTETDYISPTAVQNYITNSSGFTNLSGWEVGSDGSSNYPDLDLYGTPDIFSSDYNDNTPFRSFVKYFPYKKNEQSQEINTPIYNSGFADNRSQIHQLTVDEEFVIDMRACEFSASGALVPYKDEEITKKVTVKICEYELDEGKYDYGETYFEGTLSFDEKGYGSAIIKSKVSKAYKDLIIKKIGIFFEVQNHILIEQVRFYRKVEYERLKQDSQTEYETVIAEPGGELFSAARTKYFYYNPDQDYDSLESLQYKYIGYEEQSYPKKYNEGAAQFEKIRSVTASESNRFNLIQDLCELFECWAKFEIEHEPNGEISLDENYRQKKWISFHEYIGEPNYIGFKYGINLKSIQRTINSDSIVSKIVVKDNSNEFAPNGFCSIARAMDNPSGENFIYNFDHYISQEMLDFDVINNDLYVSQSGYLGYYKKLRELNLQREQHIDKQAKLLTDIANYEAQYQSYKISVDSAEEEVRRLEQKILDMTGQSWQDLRVNTEQSWTTNEEVQSIGFTLTYLKSLIASHTTLRDVNKTYLTSAETEYNNLDKTLADLAAQKRALNLEFYKKYSRFIQEGSWISEDYIDENLYYMDAESTLATSARPKITYNISVLELSQLEGYEAYHFALGDKTFVEDTEFFGWTWKGQDKVKTPYQEEVVISEITWELDSPEKNIIKVQNFKTQFEDLFQRITATTQSIEFHSGEYGRVTSVVETDGSIKASSLQNSFANNSFILSNARDQSVVIDENGITSTSLAYPNEMIRLVSGGLFLSTDGGTTWSTGITGGGINANYITTGQINTDKIFIMNGKFPSFRWDGHGINAYQFQLDSHGAPYAFNESIYTRFDQYGLYGIKGEENFIPTDENSIWDKANFALTWKGFMLKNKYGNGFVSIDSINDFIVSDGAVQRIKIGKIDKIDEENVYGIRIKNKKMKQLWKPMTVASYG